MIVGSWVSGWGAQVTLLGHFNEEMFSFVVRKFNSQNQLLRGKHFFILVV